MTIFSRPRAILRALVPVLALFGFAAEAQAQATFRGRVISERGEPIANGAVGIAELGLTTQTDVRGTYTLIVPAARVSGQQVTLSVRAIGYRSRSIAVSLVAGDRTIDFSLNQDINRLQEVIVTGVMEGVERSKVPFAVGRVTAEDLPVVAVDPVRALQGKVAGVRIAQTTGYPGATPEILLRGPTSINASGRGQGPLIIIDDVIMNVGSLQELGGMDIESIEVVKGAAGASLYGTRAANGVITIRTKRGLTGGNDGVRFNVRTEYGFSDLGSLDYGIPENHPLQLDESGKRFCVIVSGQQPCSRTMDVNREMQRINGVNSDTVRVGQSAQYFNPVAADLRNLYQAQIWPNRYYNAVAQLVGKQPTLLTNLDATGRVGNVSFYVSGSYTDEAGALTVLNGVQNKRARVNLDFDARSDLRISVSTFADKLNDDNDGFAFGGVLRGLLPGVDQLQRDTLGRALLISGGTGWRPTANGGGGVVYGPENSIAYRESTRFLASMTARYAPVDWATFESTIGYDIRNRQDVGITPSGWRTQTIAANTNRGNMGISSMVDESVNAALSATFRKQIGEELSGKLSFRGVYDENNWNNDATNGAQFTVKDIHTLSNTTTSKTNSSSIFTTKNVGLFAGASLDWKDRYIVEGSFRYDGSSLFGEGNRWSPFGRVSAVWNVGREPFWNIGFMEEFRLRASRGTAGTTPPFAAQYETYTISGTSVTLGQAGNRFIKPETTTEYEFGTDFTLFGKVGVEVTYAHSTTRDQILPVSTAASLGFSTQWQNAGTLQNKTWELGVNLPIVNSSTLFWQMRGTWDQTRTHITELFVPDFIYTGGTAQGTGSFFYMTANTEKQNGFALNRYGNVYGRKFYKTCGDLPASVQPDCGPGKAYQVDSKGWLVWVGAGNSTSDGITRNLWTTVLPASESPWNYDLSWGHPIVDRPLRGEPGAGVGKNQIIGNVFPDFRFTFTNDIQYKNLTLYTLLDATIGHEINNQGEGWGLLDLSSAYFDMANETVETAKPLGYSWRAGGPESTGVGGFYDVLGPNNYTVEDGSYAKLREVSLTYKFGQIAGVGDWTVGLIARNLLTITNYSGMDPEVGVSGGATGSGLINQTDAFNMPPLRQFTFSVSTRF